MATPLGGHMEVKKMASIYIYNLKGGKCVELSTPHIHDEDIAELRSVLPPKLEGLAFDSPLNRFGEDSLSEIRVEDRDTRVAEYLKGIGRKLEQLKQTPGALRFYDLAFRLGKNAEILLMKARVLGQLGYVDRADRLIRKYLKVQPQDPEPHYLLGRYALSRNDYSQAHEYFQLAQNLLRNRNVEHRQLKELVEVYLRFVSIYLDRDNLFNRNLPPEELLNEIQGLRNRTQSLIRDTQASSNSDLEGMSFFLDAQDKIFERWIQELES